MSYRRMKAAPADTVQRIHQYVECASAGLTVAETAQQMGMTVGALHGWKHRIQYGRGIRLPRIPDGRSGRIEQEPRKSRRRASGRSTALVRRLRKSTGMTQTELAAVIGVTPAAVNHWELGRAEPTVDHLMVLKSVAKYPTGVDIVSAF